MRTAAIFRSDGYSLYVFCAAVIRTKIRGDYYENPRTDLFARSQRHPAGYFHLWRSDAETDFGSVPTERRTDQKSVVLSLQAKTIVPFGRLLFPDTGAAERPRPWFGSSGHSTGGLYGAGRVSRRRRISCEDHLSCRLAGGEVYEILYAEPGKEAILNLLLARPEQEPPVRLVILEDAAQVDLLAIPNVRAYCLLDGDGNIQYLQEETEGSF